MRWPCFQSPRWVLSRVSPEASTANQSRALLDHRQAAARAGDRGAHRRPAPCRAWCGRRSDGRRLAARRVTAVISPTSVTMPVNMAATYAARCQVSTTSPPSDRAETRVNRGAKPSFSTPRAPTAERLSAAHQQAGLVAGDAVDQAGLQEGRRDLPAAFDQHAGRAGARRAREPPPRCRPGPRALDATSITSTPLRLQGLACCRRRRRPCRRARPASCWRSGQASSRATSAPSNRARSAPASGRQVRAAGR